MGNLYYMALPDGERQQGRDEAFRQKSSQGLSPICGECKASSDIWNGVKDLLGYDAEDEGEDWWVQWGILRERATRGEITPSIGIVAQAISVRCIL